MGDFRGQTDPVADPPIPRTDVTDKRARSMSRIVPAHIACIAEVAQVQMLMLEPERKPASDLDVIARHDTAQAAADPIGQLKRHKTQHGRWGKRRQAWIAI